MTDPQPPGATPAGPDHPDPANTTAAGGRGGYLYAKVARFLASRPGQMMKVGDITRSIAAPSTGAVFEVLKKMAAAGHATHLPSPHRFQITDAGITAAATAATVGRAGPATGRRSTRPGPVTRPNGQPYYPRRLGKGWDVQELQRLREQQVPVLLYGPPGTGKTAMVEAAFPDLLTVAGTGDTVVDDFVGTYKPLPGGGYEFVHGPLVTAMREGRVLLIDDATLIPPRVLAVAYPAMDGRGVITIPAHGNEQVNAAAGFYIVAGHNPGVHGAVLTDALASRFTVHLEVTTDWDLAARLGAPRNAINAAIELNNLVTAGRLTWAPQLRELIGFVNVRRTLGLAAAIGNLAGRAPEDDRPDVTSVLAKHFGTPVTPLTVGRPPS
jgi:nitric oxide reductase NorQ protein